MISLARQTKRFVDTPKHLEMSLLSRFEVTNKTGFGLDLLHLIHSHISELQARTALSLIYIVYSSPFHTH
jgi:hypothetical protein